MKIFSRALIALLLLTGAAHAGGDDAYNNAKVSLFAKSTNAGDTPVKVTSQGYIGMDLRTIAGVALDTNSGNKSAGTLRVVVATDQPALPVTGTFWQSTQPVSGTFWQSTQPTSVADGSNTTFGAKADAKSTATDTTAVSAMSVLKQISASVQAPPSQAVTNAGTFATQSAITAASGAVASGAYASGSIADGAEVTLGAKGDAKSTATDTTSITIMQVLKEVSAMEQAPASRAVTNAGTFATQSAITAASGSIASGALASGSIASGAVASGAVASGAYASGSISDGAEVTLGAKADAKSTATDTTAVTVMQVLKEISAMAQAPAALPANQSVNVAQVNGGTTVTAATGVQKVGVVGNAGAAVDAATGAAPPANALYQGVQVGGATGGHIAAPIVCDSKIVYDASTNGVTKLVAKVASQNIYVCGFTIFSAGTVNVKLTSGTKVTTECDTSTVNETPAYQLLAQTGVVDQHTYGNTFKVATNTDLCLSTSAGVAVQGLVYYAQF